MDETTVRDIIQWDVCSWSEILPFWEKQVDWTSVQDCLELGGREGGLSLWIGLKGKSVICSDINDTRQQARNLFAKYGVENKVSYQAIDASRIGYEGRFDIIIFKSILGGVGYGNNKEAQQRVFDEVYKALKPGGKLLFAENLAATRIHQQLRKRFLKWGSGWRYVTTSEIEEFTGRYSSVTMQTTGFAAAFGKSEAQKNALARLDRALLNNLMPSSWHYIVYGVATK